MLAAPEVDALLDVTLTLAVTVTRLVTALTVLPRVVNTGVSRGILIDDDFCLSPTVAFGAIHYSGGYELISGQKQIL